MQKKYYLTMLINNIHSYKYIKYIHLLISIIFFISVSLLCYFFYNILYVYDIRKQKIEHTNIISKCTNINSIMMHYGINIHDINMLIKQHPEILKLGKTSYLNLTTNRNLQSLKCKISCNETHYYDRINNFYKKRIITINDKWYFTKISGILNKSFITSARAVGLTIYDIKSAINALHWQLDFRKLRKGDKFSVILSRKILLDEITNSKLVGICLRTGGKYFYAFLAKNGKFYNKLAVCLSNKFILFPTLKPFPVSSNFNLKRLNPVTGRITPHRGVDFAVPVGTIVLAVDDGEVVMSKNDVIAGNYLSILHNHKYMTRYMHLKKILVKKGQKVKRGEHIALSGNTGRSTGPHLHFEVWINRQAVNPLTVKLPYKESLSGSDLEEYLFHVKNILPKLKLN